jgi:hypothetical protein
MTVLTVQNVTCRKCNMIATIDANRLCEFCRPREAKVTISPDQPQWADFEWADVWVLGFAVVVLGLLIAVGF